MKKQEEMLDEDAKDVLNDIQAHPEGSGIRELSRRLGMTRPMIMKKVAFLKGLQKVFVFGGKRGKKYKVLPALGLTSRERREERIMKYPAYLIFATLLCGTCSRGRDHLYWEGGEMKMADFERRIAKLEYKWSQKKKTLNWLDKCWLIDIYKENKNKFAKIVLPPFDLEEIRKPEKKYRKVGKAIIQGAEKFFESATKGEP